MEHEKLEKFDLEDVLKKCKKSASNGYDIASKHEKLLNKTLNNAKKQIEDTKNDFNKTNCCISDATKSLETQLNDIKISFDSLSKKLSNDLEKNRKNLSDFSITLFGRTMAGKSTLMEILTNGEGKSIGLGAQRTTRDVRKYRWNNIEITDVPGIGAFEGQEDEEIAFEAAKSADLILFLITDDAPQAIEAECFARIVSLGKPIICIMNVKATVSENKSIKLMMRDISKRFDRERLDSIKDQFLSYSKQMGQEWGYIPFVYVHLKAAFLSQHIDDKEKSHGLYEISQISYLKKKIVEQVINKGQFYRIKTFIDLISNPMMNSIDTLLNQSLINSTQGRTILSKKRNLENWKDKFYRDSRQQIKSLIKNINSQLKSEIALFAEEHFSDEHADKAWNKILKEKRIDTKCKDLLDNLETQCNDRIKELSREIENELKFSSYIASDSSLKMNKIIDKKRLWDWTTTILGGGLSIGAGIAFLAGATLFTPLGWAALGVSIIGIVGSFLFKSRDKKENEARIKLENNLNKNVENICDSLQKEMLANLDKLVNKRIVLLTKELDRINSVIFRLADTQKELAWKINSNLVQLNIQIVTEAIHLIGAQGLEFHINSVARIPGVSTLIMLDDGKRFPDDISKNLYLLMSEKIRYVFYDENKKVLISRIIGKTINRRDINIEENIGIAHIPLENTTPDVLNRVKLAQQLSEILITK
ncbi:GTPase [Clostridium perfringens]|uniref:GTPase n=1 Tax=Clostridium perfringens TaxID=1502 RepID=UPI00016BCA4C|nr:GTPase [Clostridium perfringens]EDT79341.1 putative GTPase [Clostridium perfringens NCTC 8239]EGT0692223.1 GTPase [Clostridium perfringens]EHK2425929.1 50S ribosome-binding GTPase [Clostridium perfringens]ELC8383056.1 50S ribosome-binding GTPase [Clostridium perfringens]MDB2046171.1 50S ribosome-binding GTPase [Clostridium perfringens]